MDTDGKESCRRFTQAIPQVIRLEAFQSLMQGQSLMQTKASGFPEQGVDLGAGSRPASSPKRPLLCWVGYGEGLGYPLKSSPAPTSLEPLGRGSEIALECGGERRLLEEPRPRLPHSSPEFYTVDY